jgi:predicted amidohydrolase YtcJ
MALLPDITFDELESGLDTWSARLLSQGVTGISAICQSTDEGPSGPAGALESVGWSVLVDRVPFDVQTILIAPDLQAVHDLRAGSTLHDPAARRRVDAVKLFLDGTLGGATACMHLPFTDRTDTHGMRTMGDDEAYRRMVEAHLAGLQVCVHAIGDRANRDTAELFARLLDEHPGPHRHRVEHASVLDERTIELFATHGITTVVQPINLRSERHWLAGRIGAERLGHTYPYRALLDAGVAVAGSSDAPIESTDVLAAIGACVERGGLADEQAISATEALGLYTTGAAFARRTEDDAGALRPGQRADLVVLDADPTVVDPATVTVHVTTIGGVERFVHPRSVRTP